MKLESCLSTFEYIQELSAEIETIRTPWSVFNFHFTVWKYGQRYEISSFPVTLESLNLHLIFDEDLVEQVSLHLAMNFQGKVALLGSSTH